MKPTPLVITRALTAPPQRGTRAAGVSIPPNMRARLAQAEARAWAHSPLAGALFELGMRATLAISTSAKYFRETQNNCCAVDKSAVISPRGHATPDRADPGNKLEKNDMKLKYGQKNPHNTTGINPCDFGTIIKDDGEIIDLTQQAYVNQGGTPTAVWYEAHAISRTRKDSDGEPIAYKVFWQILEGAEELEDESDCCNWDDFEIKEI